ncbi:MAG: Crp/Fnr family transcriptional regulator [Bacteroidales bacterium]
MGGISNYTACTVGQSNFQCFDKLSDSERKLIDDNSVKIKYRKGETICKQGGFVTQVMFLETGLAKVFIDSGGNTLVLKIICDGNFIGLSSVSEGSNTYQYTVTTYVDSEVRQIDLLVFRSLLSSNAEFSREIIDILTANSAQIYGRFFCLTNKQAYGRLADIILCLSERVFKSHDFDLPLSRRDLAELSGMSAETVIRILKRFSDEQLIEMDGKKFRILDAPSLQRISETG